MITKNKDHSLSLFLGRQYTQSEEHFKAFRCFLLARAPMDLCEAVEYFKGSLLRGEYDLFILRSALEYALSLTTGF